MRTHLPKLLTATALVAAALAIGVSAATAAPARKVPAGSEPTNLGPLKNQIRAYYGDTGANQPSATSAYATDVATAEADFQTFVNGHKTLAKPALVFDVDDTLLNSYNFGATHDFGFTSEFLNCWQTECQSPVYGMPQLVNAEKANGFAIFYVTSRPDVLQSVTQKALTDAGFPAGDGLFLKPTATAPSYLTCGITCDTVDFKSQTRRHIQTMGFPIIGNVGDQQSDLDGGFALKTEKVPNPMYFTP